MDLDNLVRLPRSLPCSTQAYCIAWKDAQQQKASGYPISPTPRQGTAVAGLPDWRPPGCSTVQRSEHWAREDAYTNIYDYMLGITGDSAKISRDMAKEAVNI